MLDENIMFCYLDISARVTATVYYFAIDLYDKNAATLVKAQ